MEGQDVGVPSLFTATLVQLFVGVLLFVALLNSQRDLIVLTLLVLGVIVGARLWARLGLTGLQCHLKVDRRRVFPGDQVTLTISAENTKPLPIWLRVLVPIGDLLERSTGERVLTKETSLLWFQRTQFQWNLTAERRGVYQLGPLDILAGDLFSFFSRHRRAYESHTLIVYPRLAALRSFSLPRRDFFGVPRASSPVQDPVYILGTRDYQHGRPSKYIHWKASARHNRLQEKVFESTVQEKVLLVVDVDSFARRDAEEDWERVLEIVAALAVRLDRQGHSVGFVANGVVKGDKSAGIPVARNEQQLAAILEVLARLEMTRDRALKDVLRRGLADEWGISCLCFSYEEDETVFSANEFFAQRNTPVMFFVCQPGIIAQGDDLEIQHKVHVLDEICAAEQTSR